VKIIVKCKKFLNVNQYVFERKMHKLNEEIEFVFNEERIKLQPIYSSSLKDYWLDLSISLSQKKRK